MRDRRVAEQIRAGRRAAWSVAVLIGVLAVGAAAGAQPAQGPRPGQPAGIAPTEDPLAVFRSGITLVTTDVIVRDEHDLFIPDLTKDDFTILEDGIPQEVASLVLVHGGRVYNQLLPPPPVQEGIILPPTRPVNDTAGRIFVILVDDLHIEANKTPKARQVFEKLADTLIHEGDLFGIISTGPSSIRVDMTYDRSRLYSAMEKITGDGFTANELINEVSPGTRGPEELRWRAHVAFKTARDTVLGLEQVQNRRKAVIYFSSGYDFNPFEFERYFARNPIAREFQQGRTYGNIFEGGMDPGFDPFTRMDRQGEVFSDADLAMEVMELAQTANRANASFYTVDPRGLLAGPDVDYNGPAQPWNEWRMQTQSSLRALAELTGGLAVVNRNDFEGAFREIDAETSDYYVLGFYSSNADPTARTRRLTVTVNREGADVRSRTHYTFARPPEEDPAP